MFNFSKMLFFVLVFVFSLCACESSSKPVVARVGRLEITQPDFYRKVSEVAHKYQNYLLTQNGRKQFLDILIREKLILAAARDSPVSGTEKYKVEVGKMEKELDLRMKEFKDYLLTKMWIEDLRERDVMKVTDDAIKTYHEKHPYEVSLAHILVATPEEAEAIMRRVRRSKSKGLFAGIAKEKSLDADTASGGGNLPPFLYGEFLPDLEDMAFKMRVGEIQGVVKSKFGYHILEKTSERKISFTQAQDRLRRLLEKKKFDEYLKTLESKYEVEVLDDRYK